MRQVVAYGLLILLLVGAAVLVAWLRYNSQNRRYDRQQRRDRERYRAMMAEKAEQDDD